MYALVALLFVRLVVTSMQHIFGGPELRRCAGQVALYSPQHNKVYEINAFYTEMFGHLGLIFLIVTRFQCPIKALNVACGNLFSRPNQCAFTTLETEVSGTTFKFFTLQKLC